MNIEELIKKTGKSLKQIAEEAEIDPKHLYKIRSGTSEPTASVIVRLCKALDCSADELLGIDPQKTKNEPTGNPTGSEK